MKTVEVKHRTMVNKHGIVNIVKAKPYQDVVVAEYDDGRVQLSNGDVWYVEKSGGSSDFETVVSYNKETKQYA